MRTPREIYAAYELLPDLQLHQLRVAAVAKLVAEHFREPVDAATVVTACLFHDMGNILKFDLTVFPEFTQPQGIEYWTKVKERFEEKYSHDQHAATLAIGRELGLPAEVLACMDAVAFSKVEATLREGGWEKILCEYADSRVGPHGIVPLEERLREARVRYLRHKQESVGIVPQDRFEELVEVEREMERNIFTHCAIRPGDITDAAVAPLIEELWEYPVA